MIRTRVFKAEEKTTFTFTFRVTSMFVTKHGVVMSPTGRDVFSIYVYLATQESRFFHMTLDIAIVVVVSGVLNIGSNETYIHRR